VTSLLLVEDEPAIGEGLTTSLEAEGFLVTWVRNGADAHATWQRVRPDLVLLDLMLPGTSGTEVCRRLRAESDVTIIMLTAKDAEADKVAGLELGADDYVTKPFSPREVVARVQAVLRRAKGAETLPGSSLVFDDLTIDGRRRVVTRWGEPVHLTRKEFDLLFHLASRPGGTFTRSQLLEDVWDFAWDGDTQTVTVHIRRLRQKIEDDPSNPRHLVTVWGVGYRFEP
jgi:two-component system, OmpR family, response regulator RegX3